MRELTRVGMRSHSLMEWVLRIMANLLREDDRWAQAGAALPHPNRSAPPLTPPVGRRVGWPVAVAISRLPIWASQE